MSTCPEKDIHSVYLDNELPAGYIKEYELHLKSCSSCRAEFERLKRLHDLFHQDSASLQLDEHILEQSFERLQSRLSYSKITAKKHISPMPIIRWGIPAAAAAAILALILPLRINTPEVTHVLFSPIRRAEAVSIARNRVVVDGTIPNTALTSIFRTRKEMENASSSYDRLEHEADFSSMEQPQTVFQINKALTSMDIFRPEFENGQTITIRVTIPSPGTMPEHTQQTTFPIINILRSQQ